MIAKEDFAVIRTLSKRGVYQKDIAVEIGVHPKTVSRALKRGSEPEKAKKKTTSKLDQYKPQIDELLAEGVWNGKVVLREIQARGYDGGYTLVRDYIQPKRTLRPSRATVRFETEPGVQLQTDWGELETEIAGKRTKVHFIVNQLGYSRRFHFWCTNSQDGEHTYEGLVQSFEYFGGTSKEVLVDNQKAAVISHSERGRPRFNERFLDLAGHYGFDARACKPYRAQTKGKDERMVGYIKHHFFVRYRSFESWVHLNQQAEQWLREEADPRIHGTLKERVSERFERERPCLQKLPDKRYDTSYRENRKVAQDAYVEVHGNRYSVPAYLAGQTVAIRIGLERTLRVYATSDTLVATHFLQDQQHGWATTPEHHAELWQNTLEVEKRSLAVYEAVA